MTDDTPGYRLEMKDVPLHQRPRERLLSHGAESLSNAELICAIVGSGGRNGGVFQLAGKILSEYSLPRLSNASVRELNKIPGLSNAKACSILSAIELGRRAACEMNVEGNTVESPDHIAKLMIPRMRNLKKEFLRGIYLDAKKRMIGNDIISIGCLNTNSVHPREVFSTAVRDSAAGMILVHNHPSGDPSPSDDDVKFTKKLIKSGKLLGIEIVDHVIIGRNGYVSFREMGII